MAMKMPMSRSSSPNSTMTIGVDQRHERRQGVDRGVRPSTSSARVSPDGCGCYDRAAMPTSPAPRRRRRGAQGCRARRRSLEASLIATVAPLMRHLRRPRPPPARVERADLPAVQRAAHDRHARAAAAGRGRAPPDGDRAGRHAAGIDPRRCRPRRAPGRSEGPARRDAWRSTATGRRRARAMRRDLLAAAHELLEPLPEERRAAVAARARGAPGPAPRALSAPLRRPAPRARSPRRARRAVEDRDPQRAAPRARRAARARRRRA